MFYWGHSHLALLISQQYPLTFVLLSAPIFAFPQNQGFNTPCRLLGASFLTASRQGLCRNNLLRIVLLPFLQPTSSPSRATSYSFTSQAFPELPRLLCTPLICSYMFFTFPCQLYCKHLLIVRIPLWTLIKFHEDKCDDLFLIIYAGTIT